MSQHFKKLTLGGLNEVWNELMSRDYEQKKRIEQAQNVAVQKANILAEEAICRSREEMIRKLNNEVNCLQNSTNRKLEELDREQRQRLSRMANQLSHDIKSWTHSQLEPIQVDIRQIFQKYENEEQLAQEMITFVNALLKVIKQRTPVERYTPEQLRNIEARLRDLQNCNHPATSVIAIADGVMHGILEMEEEAMKLKIKHDSLVETTKARLEAVLSIINQNHVITVDRQEGKAEIETNFWTRNGYADIQNRIVNLQSQLNKHSDEMTEDEVLALLNHVEEENQKALTCMQEAVRLAILSQSRAEISLDIVNAMIRQGYILKSENGDDAFDYMGGEIPCDWREGFFAILKDPRTGDEISVTVMPNENGRDNDIAFHLNGEEGLKTEKQYMDDLRRIRDEIMKSGYQLGEIEVPADGGNERMPLLESANSLREVGSAEQLRNRIRK